MKLQTRFAYGLGALLFVFPFVTSRHLFFGAVNAKLFYFLITVALSGLFLLFYSLRARLGQVLAARRSFLFWALAVFALAHVLSAAAGVFPLRSFWSDITRSTGVVFILLLSAWSLALNWLLEARGWAIVRWAVAISGAIFSLLTFLGTEGLGMSGRLLGVINLDIGGLTLGNSTFAGAYLVLVVLLSLQEWFRLQSGGAKRAMTVLLGLQLLSPLLYRWLALPGIWSQPLDLIGTARASSLTLSLVLIFLCGRWLIQRFLPHSAARLGRVIWAGLLILLTGGAVIALFVPGSWVQQRYITLSSAARLVVWESGWTGFQERPLLGWGPENFRLAFEKHFDNRLYQDEYLGEIWFDRAHNALVDTLVSTGVLGLLVWLLVAIFFFRNIYLARRATLLNQDEAAVLYALPLTHFLQLQTSFDTVSTYVLGGLILAYGLWLERCLGSSSLVHQQSGDSYWRRWGAGAVGACLLLVSILVLAVEYPRQAALFNLFTTGDQSRQLVLIDRALDRPDAESLRRASSSMIKGLLDQLPRVKDPEQLTASGLVQLGRFAQHYESYLAAQPNDYRVRMNYAYLLIIKTALGDNRLDQAQKLLADSDHLSPRNPLTRALEAVTLLYTGRVGDAKEVAREMLALNLSVPFSHQIVDYIAKQEKQFPNISVIKLDNL